MMKHEFEELLGRPISADNYENVEFVYMHLEKLSKKDCAKLYKLDSYFIDVLLRNFFEENDSNISKITNQLKGLQTRNNELRDNNSKFTETIIGQSRTITELHSEIKRKECRIEELETELQQYRVCMFEIMSHTDMCSELLAGLKM